MRVAHVVSQFHPGKGGLEAYVLALAKQQRLDGVNAEVVTLDRVACEPRTRLSHFDCVHGVPVRRIGFVRLGGRVLAPGILSAIDAFDIVHVHGGGFFASYLALTQLVHRKPLVISAHAGATPMPGGRIAAFAARLRTRLVLWRYARVFCGGGSDDAAARLARAEKVVRVGAGGDSSRFAGAASAKFAPSLVYFGPIGPGQGLERLVDVFDAVREVTPKARLHIAAAGGDAGTLAALRAAVAASRFASSIALSADPSDQELRGVLAKGSFYITASQCALFAPELIEALGAGLIPIVSAMPSFAAVLDGAPLGLIADFSDTARAGGEIATFINEASNAYPEHRAEAMRLASAHAWGKVAGRSGSEYETVLGSREREILGVAMRPMSRKQAVARIDCAVAARERLNVCFANAHSLNLANANESFRTALRQFLVLNDGVGVDIASRIKFGKAFSANLNGTDFVPNFLAATRHKLRIYLIGTTDAAIKAAAGKLAAAYPRHRIVGYRNGFFADADDVEITCAKVKASRADCVLVGMGNPLQELWIEQHGAKTGAKLLIGVGALFDFKSEAVRRAPEWMRNLRCEWMFRLGQEPRRLARRYLIGNFMFLSRVIADGPR